MRRLRRYARRSEAAVHGLTSPYELTKLIEAQAQAIVAANISAANVAAVEARGAVTRDKVAIPVSPVPQPTDATLFEEPANPSKKLYLPRYRLAEVEGEDRYRIAFEKAGASWSLWLDLEDFPAPELRDAARDAAILPHTVSPVLVYERSLGESGGSIQRERALETQPNEDGTLRCTLQIADLGERDELVRALSSDGSRPQLLVRRVAPIAVPIETATIPVPENANARLRSAPDVSSWGPGRLDVFGVGLRDALWHRWYEGGWSGWEELGGVITSDPGAVSWGPGRVDCFARGTDNALLHKWWEGSWSGWERLEGEVTSAPDVCSWGPGRLDVFALKDDNALWHLSWENNAWSEWEHLGGHLTSSPTAVSWGPDRIDVFARGTKNALCHLSWEKDRWSEWEDLGGELSSGPDVASWAPGRLDVVAIGMDGAMWHRAFEGTWTDWGSVGGQFTSDPSAESWGPGRLDLFGRGTDDALWHRWWEGDAWSEHWERLGVPDEPVGPWYEQTTHVLAHVAAPEEFTFSEKTHPYVYAGATRVSTADDHLILRSVRRGERAHKYYQDPRDLTRFFYLPDSFKLMRDAELPHKPMMRVTVATDTGDEVHVTLEYQAAPVTDAGRLAAAAEDLKKYLPKGAAGAMPDFEPLQVARDKLKFWLMLPRLDGAGDGGQERPEAAVSLALGIADSVTLPESHFRRVYDAMLGASSVLFRGNVEVDLGDGQTETLELSAQFDDLAGRVLEETVEERAGGYDITLRNEVGEPVNVTSVSALLRGDSSYVPLKMTGLPKMPFVVRPGDSLRGRGSVPEGSLAGGRDVVVNVDATVDVDRQKIWDAILDSGAAGEYDRKIKVDGSAFFKPKDPKDPVLRIIVDFGRGDSLLLDPKNRSGIARVRSSISDLVVHRKRSASYTYRYKVVRASDIAKGGTSEDPKWKTTTSTTLYLGAD